MYSLVSANVVRYFRVLERLGMVYSPVFEISNPTCAASPAFTHLKLISIQCANMHTTPTAQYTYRAAYLAVLHDPVNSASYLRKCMCVLHFRNVIAHVRTNDLIAS